MPVNYYFNHLTIFTFIALYIISLVFFFRTRSEIISFYTLTIFQAFFILFILQTLLKYETNKVMFIPMTMIVSVLIASIFKFVSLVCILVMFKNLNIGYDLEKAGSKSLPSQYRKYMNDYKILFAINICAILLLLLAFMINFDTLNQININNLTTNLLNSMILPNILNILPSLFLLMISLSIIGTTAWEVYIGNKFSKIHKKRIQI